MDCCPNSSSRAKLTEHLKARMADLPFFSDDLPGIGGTLKVEPEHFQVEEILPYEACGEGGHVYIRLKRSGWNTVDVAAALAKCLGQRPGDIGWGGRKDKQAVTTQTFSADLPLSLPLSEVAERLAALPFEILSLQRHRNKIKIGHVAANRFDILLTQVCPDAGEKAMAIAGALRQRGVPNYYGEQRFGLQMRNIERAALLLERGRQARGRPDPFMVSVLQSALFNIWLKQRIARGDGRRILPGDVIRKSDTGGLFTASEVEEVQARFDQGAVSYTGPIFGHKMMAGASTARVYEDQLLKEFGLEPECFKPLRAAGSRRVGLLFLNELQVLPEKEGLRFRFSLPSGSYATAVMREFTRTSAADGRYDRLDVG